MDLFVETCAIPIPVDPPFYDLAIKHALDAKFWRRAFTAAMLFAFVSLSGLLFKQEKIYPFLVTLRPGEALTPVGIIPATFDIHSAPLAMVSILEDWITNVRQLSTDPAAWEQLFDRAESFQSTKAITMLRPFRQSQKDRFSQNKVVSIEVLAIQPLVGTNAHTWEVDWREHTYDQLGNELPEESFIWHATVKMIQLPPLPLSKPGQYRNPYRIYVDEVSWQRK